MATKWVQYSGRWISCYYEIHGGARTCWAWLSATALRLVRLAIGALTGEPITVRLQGNTLVVPYEQMGITIETGDRWAGFSPARS